MIFNDYSLINQILLIGFIIFVFVGFCGFGFKIIEMCYVFKYKKPLYNHLYFHLKKLNENQKKVLENQFLFYNKLTEKQQKYFEHRLVLFLNSKAFFGREGALITTEVKVLIAATAVMLTFGFRNFDIGLISKIIVYPKVFFSKTNNAYHKGEFNPNLKLLVFSWEDFKQGYAIDNDNLNLGIHEFVHAIQLNSKKRKGVSAVIFSDTFKELLQLLSSNEMLRNKLLNSDYFRGYAYTNQFEFLAVAIESFIETPKAFKSSFPGIYSKIKQMLNFNIAGY